MVFRYATLGLLAFGYSPSNGLAQAVARNLHHFKHRSEEVEKEKEAVRVEFKAVIKDRSWQGEKSMHGGRHVHGDHHHDLADTLDAALACPAWCQTIPEPYRQLSPPCAQCKKTAAMDEEEDEYSSSSSSSEEDYEGRHHDGNRSHHKHRSDTEEAEGEQVRVEFKAVVKDHEWQGERSVSRGKHMRGSDGDNYEIESAAVAPSELQGVQACAAYCQTTPRLTQQYDPNCSGCPGAGTAPTGNPCQARCGYSPASAWKYDPGCSGCK